MISAPSIQEYITWMASKGKAGLYMGTNFLAGGIGGLTSGLYTALYGYSRDLTHPEGLPYHGRTPGFKPGVTFRYHIEFKEILPGL